MSFESKSGVVVDFICLDVYILIAMMLLFAVCHQAVKFGTDLRAVTSHSWDGYWKVMIAYCWIYQSLVSLQAKIPSSSFA